MRFGDSAGAVCPCGEPATILVDGANPRCGVHADFDWLAFFEAVCGRGLCAHPGHQDGAP